VLMQALVVQLICSFCFFVFCLPTHWLPLFGLRGVIYCGFLIVLFVFLKVSKRMLRLVFDCIICFLKVSLSAGRKGA